MEDYLEKMLRIVEAKKEDRDTMINLLEKYLYEFSQREKKRR